MILEKEMVFRLLGQLQSRRITARHITLPSHPSRQGEVNINHQKCITNPHSAVDRKHRCGWYIVNYTSNLVKMFDTDISQILFKIDELSIYLLLFNFTGLC